MPHMRKLSAAEVSAQEQPKQGRQARPARAEPLSEHAGRATAQASGPRQTARERYQNVLPRWMRSGEPAGRQEQGKRRKW
jgi:hypothetical protein